MTDLSDAIEAPLTVLVADDSRAQRRVLSLGLSREGYRVIEAATGPEALVACDRHAVDIVICDWMMPGLSGPELIAAWREQQDGKRGYALLLTSRSSSADIAAGLGMGADDFLTKPFHAEELRARLRAGERIVRMERQLSRKAARLVSALSESQRLHDMIERDLVEARKLQQSLVRQRNVRIGRSSLALMLQPAGHVGGDLVGIVQSDGPEIAFYTIDVSGHGIASALMTARLAGYLSGMSPAQNIALRPGAGGTRLRNPVDVARRLNAHMLTDLDSDLYCTFAMARVDLLTARLCLAQAGQPLAMLIRQRQGLLRKLGCGGQPLGLFEDPIIDTVSAELSAGDRLLLVSDGLTELTDENGHDIDETRIEAAILSQAHLAGDAFLAALTQRLASLTKGGRFSDDTSAAVFDYNAPNS